MFYLSSNDEGILARNDTQRLPVSRFPKALAPPEEYLGIDEPLPQWCDEKHEQKTPQ